MDVRGKIRFLSLFIVAALVSAQGLVLAPTAAVACNPTDVSGHDTSVVWRLGGALEHGVLKGTTLYAPSKTGLAVYDVSGDTTPTLLGEADLGGPASVVSVDGTRACVGGSFAGLKIIDVTDSSEPTQVGVFRLDDTSRIQGVAVKGDWAFVSYEGHGFKSVDISDPTAPHYACYIGMPEGFDRYGAVTLSGDTAYVVAVSSNGSGVASGAAKAGAPAGGCTVAVADGVTAIDVTDPASMQRKGTWTAPAGSALVALAADGSTVLAADPGRGVEQLSFADSNTPTSADVFTGAGTGTHDVVLDGGKAYIADADAGLSVLSTDAYPTYLYSILGTWASGASPYRWLAVDGTRGVMGDGGGFQVLDVTNPASIGGLGRHETLPENALDAKVVGDYVYGFDKPFGVFAAHVGAGMPQITWSESDKGADSASLGATGTRLVVGAGGKLRAFSLTDPAAPALLGETSTTAEVSGVALDGTTAYLAERNGDVEVFDVSGAGAPAKLGEWTGASASPAVPQLNGVYVHDGRAYVAAGEYTLPSSGAVKVACETPTDAVIVLDVHDPADIAEACRIGTIGGAVSVAGEGDRLFIGTTMKLQQADISDPANAHIVGNYLYFGYPLRGVGLDSENDLVWAATQDGLFAIDVSNQDAPYAIGNFGGSGFDALTVKMDGDTAVTAGGGSGVVAVQSMAHRNAGLDRYGTSVELSRKTFASADSVVLTTGRGFADAVCGAPLAHQLGAPMLLTAKDSLPQPVRDEIVRLGAKNAYVLGGTGAVGDTVRTELEGMGLMVTRLSGNNRYETSDAIADELAKLKGVTSFPSAFVASGEDFPDALAASGVAAQAGVPVLLTLPQSLPAATVEALDTYHITRTWVAGGAGAVSDPVARALGRRGPSARLAGSDRYATAAAISAYSLGHGFGAGTVIVTTGENYPDALVAGAVSAHSLAPLVLTRGGSLPGATASYLDAHRGQLRGALLVGGSGAISSDVAVSIAQYLH